MSKLAPCLTGSRALAIVNPEFKVDDKADWDILCEPNEVEYFKRFERFDVHSYDELNNRGMTHSFGAVCGVLDNRFFVGDRELMVMNLAGQTIMKRSHLWRAYNFDKHITMYHKYLLPLYEEDHSEDGFLASHQLYLDERIALTKEAYPQGNPSLKQTNKDFFDDAVKKIYDHDWLHELVAYESRPMYENLKKPDNMDDAWCEQGLWECLRHSDKIKCVAEETHVIAIERFMIPNNWNHPEKLAYFKALNKVCTTLTSGWFRDFAIDNFPEVLNMFNLGKFNKVKQATLLSTH